MSVTANRAEENPILTPAMVQPSNPDLRVVGVFNPAVTRLGRDVVLLLRVAETPLITPGEIAAPVFNVHRGRVEVKRWRLDTESPDVSDPRVIVADGRTWLTSISHLRVARSTDGFNFTVDRTPALSPATAYETFGIEDARITRVAGTFWINYTAVSPLGIATALASTTDFRTFQRHGIIFPPSNRDVAIFSEKIGGRWFALHRPMPAGIGEPSIWSASSPDLISWGEHRLVAAPRSESWDDLKVGAGAVPFPVCAGGEDGWLAIYHGVTAASSRYSLGALLLAGRDPSRVIARSRESILRPDADYERQGFFGEVVFTCGALVEGDLVRIYYGAADTVTAVADLSLDGILRGLSEP